MANEYTTGAIWSNTMPQWQRDYFERVLMDTVRMNSILVPFCAVKEDFRAKDTGILTYTEVYDLEPNYNALSEQDIWLRGAYLDSRTVSLTMNIYGDTLKFSDYSEIMTYINSGNLKGLVKEKMGQSVKDTLDILARNAFLSHPHKVFAGGQRADRASIVAGDLFDPDFGELARTHLEEAEVPGVGGVQDGDGQVLVCVTTPRVIHDIRTAAGSNWLEVQQYAGAQRKFTNEVGTWGGVRYIKTNRNVLRNHGAVVQQTALNGATVPGQGAAATVDVVYRVGQSTSTRYVTVDSTVGFAVGDILTVHDQNLNGGAGNPPLETDGTQETRRIVAIDAGNNRLTFDKPLLKPHADNDLVTKGVTIHASIFMGGPAVVYGIAERPTPIIPPKYDDMMMINRYGWRGFLKFQLFRPEFLEVHETAGTSD
jgi:N4-gp56 family major capsid protein